MPDGVSPVLTVYVRGGRFFFLLPLPLGDDVDCAGCELSCAPGELPSSLVVLSTTMNKASAKATSASGARKRAGLRPAIAVDDTRGSGRSRRLRRRSAERPG